MILNLQATNVYQRNYDAFYDDALRIIVNQGGTRSSKTYSIAQLLVTHLLQLDYPKVQVTILRKTFNALRESAMKDFFEILNTHDLYHTENHNKTYNTYFLNGHEVQFMGLDQPQKKRGTKRHYAWINEANDLSFEDYQQIIMRTTDKLILDFNPSDEYHWIYDKVITREDAKLIISTYLDNPFLGKALVDEIEKLKELDETYWQVYGLGQKATAKETIYTNWVEIDRMPLDFDEQGYGIDFGFNNPSVILHVGILDDDIYIDEILYRSGMLNTELIAEAKVNMMKMDAEFIGDSASPDKIEEWRAHGFNMSGAYKGPNSVNDGIDYLKRKKIYVTKRSVSTIKEIKNYKWRKDKDGKVLDEPLKFMDHAMDAMRYWVYRGPETARRQELMETLII